MIKPTALVLNIDDDEAGRYAIGRTLRQAGFEVLEAGTGEDGLKKLEANKPDLVLLDIRLPDIDGFEVCRRIRANPETSGIPVLQMSASYLDVSARVKGLENGADAYLTEPTEPPILIATINSLLRLKAAENTVRQTARAWQSTFDAIGEGVALLDRNGQLTRHNHAFQPSPELDEVLLRAFDRVRESSLRYEEELVIGERSLMVTLHPVSDEAGRFAGAVCVAGDITEKKHFEAQLRQTARLESIGVLAGGIAHDFNNLLTGILGNSSLLLETLPADMPDRDLVLEIIRASESAADLTRQILAYSGKSRFIMTPVDLSKLAVDSRAFVRRFIPPKVELTYEMDDDIPPIKADASQMQQLLMNLIINAAESFEPGASGAVRVSTGREELPASFFCPGEEGEPGDYVKLCVADTGSGMNDETKSRIFDPFFTTKFTGRGLGLSAVHGILRAHNGLLRLKTAIGRGTTFHLYFPASKERLETVQPETNAAAPVAASGTVLLADDESVVRKFAAAALELKGFKVLVAQNGEEAVDLFLKNREQIRLVLLDLTMPVLDGIEAFDRIRRAAPSIPVVLSTGFSISAASERFQGKSITGFLGKPFTGARLLEAVYAALQASSS